MHIAWGIVGRVREEGMPCKSILILVGWGRESENDSKEASPVVLNTNQARELNQDPIPLDSHIQ